MYNLKRAKGTFKGTIAECMFKITEKYAVLPRYFHLPKYLSVFGKHFTKEQQDFLKKYWYTIDAIKVDYMSKHIIVYEVKSKNRYERELYYKPKITKSTCDVLTEAKQLGFVVKGVIVRFCDNWEYEVIISDFSISNYCVDKPKIYDLPRGQI